MTKEMDDRLAVLIGANVNFVRFGNQFDLNLYGGVNREHKYANLQIEADFELSSDEELYTVKPGDKETLYPALELINTKLVNIKLTHEYELFMSFSNGMKLRVAPIGKYEAWTLSGDDLAFYVALPK